MTTKSKYWTFKADSRSEFQGDYTSRVTKNYKRDYKKGKRIGGVFERFNKIFQGSKKGLELVNANWKVCKKEGNLEKFEIPRFVTGYFENDVPVSLDFIKEHTHGKDFEFTISEEMVSVPDGYEQQRFE